MKNITSIIFNSVKFSILLDDNNEVVLIPFKPTSPIIPEYNTYYPLPSVPIAVDFDFSTLYLNYSTVKNITKTEFVSECGYWSSDKIDLQHAVSYSYLSDYPHCHIQFKQGCDWGNDNDDKNISDYFKDELYYYSRQKFEVIHFNGSHFNKFVAKVFDEIRMAVSDLADMGSYDVVKQCVKKNWDKLAYKAVIKFYDDFGFNRWAGLVETGNTPPCGGHQDANKGGGGRAGLSHLTPLTVMIAQQTAIIGFEKYRNDIKIIRRKTGKQHDNDKLLPFNRSFPNPHVKIDKNGDLLHCDWACPLSFDNDKIMSLWNIPKYDDMQFTDIKTQDKRQRREFSYKVLQNIRFYAQNTSVKFLSMITLTYPTLFPMCGLVAKRHLNTFFKSFKRFLKKLGLSDFEYLWFCEFQKRNAVHFHILLDIDLTQFGELDTVKSYNSNGSFKREFQTIKSLQSWALARWADIVKTPLDSHDKYGNPIIWQPTEEGLKRHDVSGVTWEVIKNQDGAARYVAKYANKKHQKVIPPHFENIGNFWYASKGVKPKPDKIYLGTEQDIKNVLIDVGAHESVQKKDFLPTVLYGIGKNISDSDMSWRSHVITMSDLIPSRSLTFSRQIRMDSEGDIVTTYKPVGNLSYNRTDLRNITLHDISQAKLRLAGFSGYPPIEAKPFDIEELLQKHELEHDKHERWWLYVQKLLDSGLSFDNAFKALGLDWRAKALYLSLMCDMDIVEAKNEALLNEFQIEEDFKNGLSELLQNEDYTGSFNRAMTELLEIVNK